jgi:hypothetical protein
MGINMKFLLLIPALLFYSITQASEKIYKWVDASGQTHYTTKKPDDQHSQEMNIRVAKTQPATTTQNDEAQEKITATERFDEFRKTKEENKNRKAKLKQRCQKAKTTNARFKEQVRFSRTTADGEKHYLEDSQREEILNASNQAIKKYCK